MKLLFILSVLSSCALFTVKRELSVEQKSKMNKVAMVTTFKDDFHYLIQGGTIFQNTYEKIDSKKYGLKNYVVKNFKSQFSKKLSLKKIDFLSSIKLEGHFESESYMNFFKMLDKKGYTHAFVVYPTVEYNSKSSFQNGYGISRSASMFYKSDPVIYFMAQVFVFDVKKKAAIASNYSWSRKSGFGAKDLEKLPFKLKQKFSEYSSAEKGKIFSITKKMISKGAETAASNFLVMKSN